MADILTKEQRSYNMSQIRYKDTKPELLLRKLLFKNGIRGYRIGPKLPGRPDIVFGRHKLAVFVDGCFWHKCPKCFVKPRTNRGFWMKKINGNVRRDRRVERRLHELGYETLRFYEHEIRLDLNRCYLTIYRRLARKGFGHGKK